MPPLNLCQRVGGYNPNNDNWKLKWSWHIRLPSPYVQLSLLILSHKLLGYTMGTLSIISFLCVLIFSLFYNTKQDKTNKQESHFTGKIPKKSIHWLSFFSFLSWSNPKKTYVYVSWVIHIIGRGGNHCPENHWR